MKKIEILNSLLIILISYGALISIYNIYSLMSTTLPAHISEFSMFSIFHPFIRQVLSILFWIGIVLLQLGISNIIKQGLFNKKSNTHLKKAGLFFIISGFFSFIIGLESFYNFQDLDTNHLIMIFPGNDFLVIIVGLTFYFISDIINEGSLLKQENDLTI